MRGPCIHSFITLIGSMSVTEDGEGRVTALYLPNQNLRLGWCFYHNCRTFIFNARLWQEGSHMITTMMYGLLNRPTNRIPIGMHIKNRHKNRNLHTLIAKIFRFFNRLYYNHGSICRCNHQARVIHITHTSRISEKISDKSQQ